ncbi:MAG TPA: hypothetical protein IAB90_07020 [Candidatus Coproplasma stercoripullorum]|uniref:Uncharacterized protein n=1 Tax=Candidatus Coproplasma stercoripullorum TaxID=2840751 RepID=A0A9D1DBT5_9FIRM|nr:hypothetical protein [Candidatus Coproplasma stercoripullorum]
MYVLLLITMAYIAAVVIVVNYLATFYFDLVTRFFEQQSSVVVEDENAENIDTEYYRLDYTSTEELVVDEREYAERVQAEGVILLQNNGLPVEAGTVTFLGLYSRDDMLSGGVDVSDNAPTMRAQFEEAGFEVNTTMIDYYNSVSAEPRP